MSEQKVVSCVWVYCNCNSYDSCSRCGGAGGKYKPVAAKPPGAGMSFLKGHPHREKLIKEGEQCTFYGVPAVDMDRDDLLMMVGYLSKEKAREIESRRKEREILGAFSKAR